MTLTETEKAIALRVAVTMPLGNVSTDQIIEFASRFLDELKKSAEPVCWMQSNHLTMFKQHHCGSSMSMVRCSDHKAMDDFQPLYLHPPAPQPDLQDELTRLRKIEAEAIKALGHPEWSGDAWYGDMCALDDALKDG